MVLVFAVALSLAALLTALVAVTTFLLRRTHLLVGELAALSARVDELAARLEADEQDLARAATSADVAETLLVEKGVADEDDVEDARRRFGAGADGASTDDAHTRDGDLH